MFGLDLVWQLSGFEQHWPLHRRFISTTVLYFIRSKSQQGRGLTIHSLLLNPRGGRGGTPRNVNLSRDRSQDTGGQMDQLWIPSGFTERRERQPRLREGKVGWANINQNSKHPLKLGRYLAKSCIGGPGYSYLQSNTYLVYFGHREASFQTPVNKDVEFLVCQCNHYFQYSSSPWILRGMISHMDLLNEKGLHSFLRALVKFWLY